MLNAIRRFSINQIKDDLENYGFYLKHSEEQKKRIQSLEEQMCSPHSTTYSAVPLHGGSSSHEERLIDLIAQKQKLEDDIAEGESLAREFDGYIKNMNETQKDIILTLWVFHERSGIHHLSKKYCYSASTIYRISDEALSQIARLRYGTK